MEDLDSTITVQISCKIPIVLWDKVKDIARCTGTTATNLTIKSLQGLITTHYKERDLKGLNKGDRISVTYKNGGQFIQHIVTERNGVLGIFIRKSGKFFIPLSDCKEIE
jgi:hypothetical protein